MIQIRIGETAFGTVMRKVDSTTIRGMRYYANIGGERVVIHDRYGACFVQVLKAPRDMDTQGYE